MNVLRGFVVGAGLEVTEPWMEVVTLGLVAWVSFRVKHVRLRTRFILFFLPSIFFNFYDLLHMSSEVMRTLYPIVY